MRDYHIYTYKAIWAAAVREERSWCVRDYHIYTYKAIWATYTPTRLYGLQQLERSWCVRDYHIYTYKAIWAAVVREELVCERLPHIHLQGYMDCSS